MKFDLPAGRRQPGAGRFIIATVTAVVLSLLACRVLVIIGLAVFPATAGYAHYSFSDYGKLTIIGVVVASLSWPLMTLVSSQARAPFLLLTILVTIVGLAPDAYIAYRGQPVDAVAVLVAMHLALALITYPALVFIAPQRDRQTATAQVRP